MNLFDLLEKEAAKKKEEPLTQLVFGGEIWSSGKFLSNYNSHSTMPNMQQCIKDYRSV